MIITSNVLGKQAKLFSILLVFLSPILLETSGSIIGYSRQPIVYFPFTGKDDKYVTMDFKKMYADKLTTPEEAVQLIQPGDAIASVGFVGESQVLLGALASHKNLNGNRIYRALATTPIFNFHPTQLKQYSFFMSGYDRHARQLSPGIVDIIPNNLSETGKAVLEREERVTLVGYVSPMDQHGNFTFGTTVGIAAEVLPISEKIIVEVNPNVPRTYGENNHIHISQITALVEGDGKVFEVPQPTLDDRDLAIGKLVANMVNDGDTIQLGIGSMPSAVAQFLLEKKDLSFHSEMMPEAIVDLYEHGVITNKYKEIDRGKSLSNFSGGTKRLYDFMDNNIDIEMTDVGYTNDKRVISSIDNFVGINSTVEVDFYGQVNAEMVDGVYYSSTGGQSEFAQAAALGKNGRNFICLYSTAKDDSISTIVPFLKEGTVVSTTKNDVDMIVTEYGIAKLKFRSLSERAEALIGIAHPKFRDELRQEAIKKGFLHA